MYIDKKGGLLYLSGTRGAKQLVVVITQTMFSAPSSVILSSITGMLVFSSSPTKRFSITTGWKPKNKHRKVHVQKIK